MVWLHYLVQVKRMLLQSIKAHLNPFIKGIVMQIEKALINDCLRVSKVSRKFCIPTIHNFAVNLLFSEKVAYFLSVPIVFSVYKQNFTAQ